MRWKEEWIHRDGFQFQVVDSQGSGPTIFWLGSARYYSRVLPKLLTERYRIVICDHRGFALRTKEGLETKEEYSLETVLQDFQVLLRETLGATETVHLVGHSGHGYMAIALASSLPHRFRTLSCIGTGPNHGKPLQEREAYLKRMGSWERIRKQEENQIRFQEDITADPKNFFVHYCRKEEALSFYDWNTDSKPFWDGVKTNTLAFDHLFGEVFVDWDMNQWLDKTTIPIRLFLGKEDFQVAPYYTWDAYLSERPNLQRIVFERCGHLPFYERAETFVGSVEDFWI